MQVSTALSERDTKAIKRRLIAIRKAVTGDNQAAFARRLGITDTRWYNFERGHPISIGIVVALMRSVPGMTSSYILEGHTERMPMELVKQLSKYDQELLPSSGSPERRAVNK